MSDAVGRIPGFHVHGFMAGSEQWFPGLEDLAIIEADGTSRPLVSKRDGFRVDEGETILQALARTARERCVTIAFIPRATVRGVPIDPAGFYQPSDFASGGMAPVEMYESAPCVGHSRPLVAIDRNAPGFQCGVIASKAYARAGVDPAAPGADGAHFHFLIHGSIEVSTEQSARIRGALRKYAPALIKAANRAASSGRHVQGHTGNFSGADYAAVSDPKEMKALPETTEPWNAVNAIVARHLGLNVVSLRDLGYTTQERDRILLEAVDAAGETPATETAATPPALPKPYAWAGERVTCPNGHDIARVVEPLVRGETLEGRLHFPHGGEGYARYQCACGQCAQRWSSVLCAWQLRIGGEWLPKEPSSDPSLPATGADMTTGRSVTW